ncbi:MAG: UvrD-helicase domain-containing protein [Syntrophothermus sp.]
MMEENKLQTAVCKTNFTAEQKSALQYSRHSLVTANAGSGKTKVFSFRYVNIALGIDVNEKGEYFRISRAPSDIRRIVAITFTEKAASELYNKIAREIDRRINTGECAPLCSHEDLYRLRRSLVSAQISTIHSFCSSLLKKFPVKSGLDPNFIPADKRKSEELIELSVEEVFRNLLDSNEEEASAIFNIADRNECAAALKDLSRILGSRQKVTEEITSLIGNKTVIFDLSGLYAKSDEEIVEMFSDKYDMLREEILSPAVENFISALEVINETVAGFVKTDSPQKIARLMKGTLEDFRKQGMPLEKLPAFFNMCKAHKAFNKNLDKLSGASYFKGEAAERCREEENSVLEFLKLYEALPPQGEAGGEESDRTAALVRFGRNVYRIFHAANSVYERRKMENGFLDFEDILLKARDLIRDDETRDALKKEIDFIMIDEYQDTNQLQYDLFLPILQEIEGRLGRGNLFVVGDEKQSIYMFRNADLQVFNRTGDDIKEAEGTVVELPHSFRMALNNCIFTNYIFDALFLKEITPAGRLMNEVKNTPLICGRGDESGGIVELMFTDRINTSEDTDEADTREEDGPVCSFTEEELVARRILKLIKEQPFKLSEEKDGKTEPVKFSFRHAAVLCRKKKSFEALERAFTSYGIPYVIMGGQGFYSGQVVKDIYNYLSFLLNQKNDTALAGILRSPFFSFSDSKIFEISGMNGFSLWAKMKHYSTETAGEFSEEIKRIIMLLKENIIKSRRSDPSKIIRKFLCETPYLAVISARENGAQDTANLEKMLKIADDYTQRGFTTLYDFVEFLSDSIENDTDENQAPVTGDDDAVRIMTLHLAKGLEFPAVFLFNTAEIPKGDKLSAKSVLTSRELGIITKLPGGSYWDEYKAAPISQAHSYIQAQREMAEAKRLLYVGVTRASDYLCISAAYKPKSNGTVSFNPLSFIGMIEKGLLRKKNFEDLLTGAPSDIEIAFDIRYKEKEGETVLTKKAARLKIPLLKNVDVEKHLPEKELKEYTLKLGTVENYSESDEILTASKYSEYIYSPASYYKKYVLGLSHIEGINDIRSYDSEGESRIKNHSALRGVAVHYILSEEIKPENITNDLVDRIIRSRIDFPYDVIASEYESFRDGVLKDLDTYHSSSVYSSINCYTDFKNEFEIWHYYDEHRFFLHGIIDKVVFNGKEALILDYKTNNVSKSGIKEKQDYYEPQLEFYAVLLSLLHPEIEKFRLRLIFTKFPDMTDEIIIMREDIVKAEERIIAAMLSIRKGAFNLPKPGR